MSKHTPIAAQEHDTSANTSAVPEPGQGKRSEEDHLGYLLHQASAAQRLRMERAMVSVGVTLPRFLVLTILRAYPGISNTDLARLTMLTPQTVSVIATNLEHSNAITRRPHVVHGRIQHIDVTPSGSTLLAACCERSGDIERNLLGGSPSKGEKVMRRQLVHVTRLGSGKPAPWSVHRFSSTAVSNALNFWVVAAIMRCILRYV